MKPPRTRRVVASGIFLAAALALALAPVAAGAQERRTVLLARVEGIITPVVADHVREGVRLAERDGHAAFLLELDTPGGLDTSMREIVRTFLGARVPIVAYVAPSGARAASAGAIISMAAHVLAMAPGTAIGAATPVDLQGGKISDKVVNDAAAYSESIARVRNRNTQFAIDAVRKGRSATVEEAVRLGVADLTADGRGALLDAIDGRKVLLANDVETTLATRGASYVAYELRGFRRILQMLADPNLAFMFMSIGTLAVLYELANPGIGAAGIVGVILIILALFSLSVLPVNAVGAVLLVLAAALFVTEVFTPGVGVFAGGGTVSLLLGGIFLFRGSVRVDAAVLVPITVIAGGGASFIALAAWRTRRIPSISGKEGLTGSHGVVRNAHGDTVDVVVDGVWWKGRSAGPALEAGRRVRVIGIEGLELIVEPEEGAQ